MLQLLRTLALLPVTQGHRPGRFGGWIRRLVLRLFGRV